MSPDPAARSSGKRLPLRNQGLTGRSASANAFQSVTPPRVLPALNGVKRCDPAQGIIDLTSPPILLCVRVRVSPGSIEQ